MRAVPKEAVEWYGGGVQLLRVQDLYRLSHVHHHCSTSSVFSTNKTYLKKVVFFDFFHCFICRPSDRSTMKQRAKKDSLNV